MLHVMRLNDTIKLLEQKLSNEVRNFVKEKSLALKLTFDKRNTKLSKVLDRDKMDLSEVEKKKKEVDEVLKAMQQELEQ